MEVEAEAETQSPGKTRARSDRGTTRRRAVMGDRFLFGLDAAAHEPLMVSE